MILSALKSMYKKGLLSLTLLGLSTSVFATSGQILQSSDFVGITFWLISMALVASTAFFFLERDRVSGKWKTETTDDTWIAKCLTNGYNELNSIFSIKSVRIGCCYHNNFIMNKKKY